MAFHIAFRNLQAPGDLLVGKSFQYKPQHLPLPVVEYRVPGGSLIARIGLGAPRVRLQVAPGHRADGLDQVA